MSTILFEQKNDKFEPKYDQSFWTELSIWREISTNNLNKFIKNVVKKTIYINHFEEKYQHSTWNKNYQQSISNRNINIRFEQSYLEFILKRKQIITIVLDRIIDTQFEQKNQQSCLNRKISKHFDQKLQQSILNKNNNNYFEKIKWTLKLNRYINNQFEQTYQQPFLNKKWTINFEQKYQQCIWTEISTIYFEQKHQKEIWMNI